MPKMRVIAVPAGEAPRWVREKWVGLELPLNAWKNPTEKRAVGVLTGPRSMLGQLWGRLRGSSHRVKGYAVSVAAAVKILAAASPEAAQWWRSNVPSLFDHNRYFMFREESCQLIAD